MERQNIMQSKIHGYTLVEIMIVVAIMAIIAAVALPMYSGYIQTSREGVLINNIATVEVFEEDIRLRTGAYQAGVFNGGADADLLVLGWAPQEDDGTVYSIVLAGASYDVTATDTSGTVVCRRLPEKIECP